MGDAFAGDVVTAQRVMYFSVRVNGFSISALGPGWGRGVSSRVIAELPVDGVQPIDFKERAMAERR